MTRSAGAALFLICCLLMPVGVTLGVWQWQKQRIRHEVRERIVRGMKREQLVVLAFSEAEARAELQWEDEREFRYQGEMYDVVDVEIEENTVRYICWKDDAETEWGRRFHETLARLCGSDPDRRDQLELLQEFLNKLYMEEGRDTRLVRPSIPKNYFASLESGVLSLRPPPGIPPPRLQSTRRQYL